MLTRDEVEFLVVVMGIVVRVFAVSLSAIVVASLTVIDITSFWVQFTLMVSSILTIASTFVGLTVAYMLRKMPKESNLITRDPDFDLSRPPIPKTGSISLRNRVRDVKKKKEYLDPITGEFYE